MMGGMPAQTITAIASLIASLTATAAYIESRRVKREVTTLNGQTMAMLADANETRRVDLIAPEDRTAGDLEHLREVPDPDQAP